MNQEKSDRDIEPKIYGVVINDDHQKIFNRRQFIKSAAVLGAASSLTGCDFSESNNEDEIEETLEKALQVREEDHEKDKGIPPTSSATGTEFEVAVCMGEVTYSHSIFQGPHVDHPLLSRTVLGEEITILGKTPDGIWYKIIDSEGTIGWVFSEFISVLSDEDIPIIVDIPTQVPDLCTCDNYAEPTSCSCDTHSTGCTCDNVCTCDAVHYWYPN